MRGLLFVNPTFSAIESSRKKTYMGIAFNLAPPLFILWPVEYSRSPSLPSTVCFNGAQNILELTVVLLTIKGRLNQWEGGGLQLRQGSFW